MAVSCRQAATDSHLAKMCDWLYTAPASPLLRHARADEDIDAVIDVRGIVQSDFRSLDLSEMPALLRPPKGRFGLIDSEKAFCPDFKNEADIFDMRGIDRQQGCMVIVRPDQYVCLLYTSPSPRDQRGSRMPSSA